MLELNHIYCGDCCDIMEKMDENSIDLVVTSPPYDDMRDYKGYWFDVIDVARHLYRVMKDGSVIVWVVGDKSTDGGETLTSLHHALTFQSIGFKVRTMIYKKAGVNYPSKYFYDKQFEYMFLFIKGDVKKTNVFNPIRDRPNKWAGHSNWGDITSRQKDGSLKLQKTKESNTYVIPEFGKRTDVWEYATGKGNTSRDSEAFEHPAPFPEKLVEDHIISWTNPGDIVFDPMSGGGTTLKVAKLLGRNYIGCDMSETYCEIAERRLKKYDRH
jgi:site-specific DNA-methyltransferase (adenine-specific)